MRSVVPRRRCQLWQFAREINESGPDVVIYGMVPSSLVSLPAACEGWLHGEVDARYAEGTDERVLALHTEVTTLATVELAGEIDESASDVVVYGMVRARLPVPNCGEQCSLGQPTLKAGHMQKVPTDNVQGVVRYGKLAGGD